jgi:transposase InsO family protein
MTITNTNNFSKSPPVFTGENYHVWHRDVTALLKRLGLFRIATGLYKAPVVAKEGATLEMLEAWYTKNDQVLGLLTEAVGPSYSSRVAEFTEATDAWSFCQTIEPRNSSSTRTYLRELVTAKYAIENDFERHVANIKQLQKLLNSIFPVKCVCNLKCTCSAKEDVSQQRLAMPDFLLEILLLESMPDELSTEVAICEATGTRQLDDTASTLKSYVAQLTAKRTASSGDTALITRAGNQQTCDYCKRRGHTREKCFKKRDDDAKAKIQYLEEQMAKIQRPEKASVSFALSISPSLPYDTYFDSGASKHMVTTEADLSNFIAEERGVQVGNKELLSSPGYGDWNLYGLTLPRTLFVPGLAANLVSISGLTRAGLKVLFDGPECCVFDCSSGKLVLKSYMSEDDMWPVTPSAQVKALAAVSADVWHQRIGHTSLKRVTDLNISDDHCFCDSCIMGKQRRRVSRLPATRATYAGELYHTDTCGPIPVASIDGMKYYHTITDDYSRTTFIWFTKTKTHYASILEEFIQYSRTQTGRNIKTLRSDNGGEFVNSEYDAVLRKNGIVHQTSVPYTPEQNGVAERANLSIWDMTRCMLIHSGCPSSFWKFAVDYAVYIKNRIGSKSIPANTTPFELFTSKKADISMLRIFGCRAFYHVPHTSSRTKLDARANKGIFVGISRLQKGYVIYDPIIRKTIISQTVTFNEDEFPYKLSNEDDLINIDSFMPYNEEEDIEIISPVETTRTTTMKDDSELSEQENHLSDIDAGVFNDSDGTSETELNTEFMTPSTSPLSSPPSSPLPIPLADIPLQETPTVSIRELRTRSGRLVQQPNRLTYYAHFSYTSDFSESEIRELANMAKDDNRCEDPNVHHSNTIAFLNRVEYAFAARSSDPREPKTYKQATTDPLLAAAWNAAMEAEYKSLLWNQAWELVPLPKGRKIVGSRWVYKVKLNADGTIERYKARVVAQGYTQVEGIDFTATFAPVSKFTTIRAICALAAADDLELHQMDVSTAFLNGELSEDEVVYMRQPEGTVEPGTEHLVCKLKKGLYGLKQSPRIWYFKMDAFLREQGFERSEHDHCLYTLCNNGKKIVLALYVDDLLLASNDMPFLQSFKDSLSQAFEMKDLGEAKYIVGLEIRRNRALRQLFLTQEGYIQRLLERFGLDDVTGVSVPISQYAKFGSPDPITEEERWFMKDKPFNSALGACMYAMVGTRPDIAYAIGVLSRYMADPRPEHWNSLIHLLRYLKQTKSQGILFDGMSPSPTTLSLYCDADHASDLSTRRSTTGFVALLAGGAISWRSKRQPHVSSSSTEAEYIALYFASLETVWIRGLLEDIGYKQPNPTPIFDDSNGAMSLASNPENQTRAKHIDIAYHGTRELIHIKKTIRLCRVDTAYMVADLLTKAVPASKVQYCARGMGIALFSGSL